MRDKYRRRYGEALRENKREIEMSRTSHTDWEREGVSVG